MLLRTREIAVDEPVDRVCGSSALSRHHNGLVGDEGSHTRRPVAAARELAGNARLQKHGVAGMGAQSAVQGLITDLAVRGVTIEPEAIDDAIADSLRQFGEALAIEWPS